MMSLKRKSEASDNVSASGCAFGLNLYMVHIHMKKAIQVLMEQSSPLAVEPSNMCVEPSADACGISATDMD
jgi:hypothetical protein